MLIPYQSLGGKHYGMDMEGRVASGWWASGDPWPSMPALFTWGS